MTILDHFQLHQFQPHTVPEFVALQIARKFSDIENFRLYVQASTHFPLPELFSLVNGFSDDELETARERLQRRLRERLSP
jgi:hypothetical protein